MHSSHFSSPPPFLHQYSISYPPSHPLVGTYSPSHFHPHFLLLLPPSLAPFPLSLLSPSSFLPPPFSLPCPSQESGTSCSVESEHVWLCSRHNNLSAVVSHLTPGQGRGGGRRERKEGEEGGGRKRKEKGREGRRGRRGAHTRFNKVSRLHCLQQLLWFPSFPPPSRISLHCST